MSSDWPFSDPPNSIAFTSEAILSGKSPILYVSHDSDDGAWQFHSGEMLGVSEAKVKALGEMVKMDPTICELADLPLGSTATREGPTKPWIREKR